ncbi:MAG: hypothetical protein OXI11_01555, partial [Gammaproteobacteria bacterium]|nr:hypothetical protein [Gammaproteobacteria bacterium]
AYAEAVALYLALAVDRLAMTGNSLVRWNPVGAKAQHCFGRQAIPMVWDYAECNFLATATGSVDAAIACAADPLGVTFPPKPSGSVCLADATAKRNFSPRITSTDPPYYDNIGYADLSDFFYVWLRRSLRPVYPDLFATLAVPKAEELVATPYRHGGKDAAEAFFLNGMTRALQQLAKRAHPGFPATIYYAFKQSERRHGGGVGSTGWETFLGAVIRSGFAISGTWPMRTELRNRMIGMGANALASSIILVCRRRAEEAPIVPLGEFLATLRAELPQALRLLQTGNVAPVDLAQAAIGPGMAVYTRYARSFGLVDGDQPLICIVDSRHRRRNASPCAPRRARERKPQTKVHGMCVVRHGLTMWAETRGAGRGGIVVKTRIHRGFGFGH